MPICNGSDRGSSFAPPERGLTSDWSWITRKVRKGETAVVTLDDVCFGIIEGPAGALRPFSTNPYREGNGWCQRRSETVGSLAV